MKQEIETRIKQHQDEIERLKEEHERRKSEIDKIKAEASRLKANVRLIELQGVLLHRIINELDSGNITTDQAFVLVKALNPLAEKDSDLSARLSIIEGQLEKFKAETEIIKAE